MRTNYHHSEETKAKIRASNLGKTHPKHTENAKKKIGEASKKLWQQDWYKEVMKNKKKGGQFPKGFTPWNKGKKLLIGRNGKEFTKGTRRRIIRDKCKQCNSIEKLELDHIIPIGKNGSNDDSNCQVLCKKCNLLKRNLDYPELYKNFNAK